MANENEAKGLNLTDIYEKRHRDLEDFSEYKHLGSDLIDTFEHFQAEARVIGDKINEVYQTSQDEKKKSFCELQFAKAAYVFSRVSNPPAEWSNDLPALIGAVFSATATRCDLLRFASLLRD